MMYLQHFNFSAPPFSIAPNPRYVYLSPQHREALAHLLFGVSAGGGFVALTGEVGTGKTTLCRCLLEQLPEDVDIAVIFNPRLNPRELVASICDELRIPHPQHRASLKLLIDRLNHHLLEVHARGRRTVVLIDEAQNLNYDVLEQIRLLTNLETDETKLLQIILVGQPELNQLLKRENLRQLSQRISARYHLRPLSSIETAAYIRHRIAISGGGSRLFSPLAEVMIHHLSGGIPRLINLICDRALLGAYTLGKTKVGCSIVRKAAREVLPPSGAWRFTNPVTGALTAIALMLVAGVYFGFVPHLDAGSIPAKLATVFEQVNLGITPRQSLTMPPASNAEQARQSHITNTDARNDPKPAVPTEPMASSAAGPPSQSNAGAGSGDTPPEPLKSETPQPDVPQPVDSSAARPTSLGPAPTPTPEGGFGKFVAEPNLTRKAAFAHLFALWGMQAPMNGEDECLSAKQNGLRCLFHKGNWSQLMSFDHPAVLEFDLIDGSKRYATLKQIRDDQAQLFLGDRTHDFALAEILPFWRGEAVLLWKPPGNNATSIKLGDNREAVKWLRDRLGIAPSGREGYFDEKLKARVIAFQMEHGLVADGLVGPQTMIHLDKQIKDPAIPWLGSKLD